MEGLEKALQILPQIQFGKNKLEQFDGLINRALILIDDTKSVQAGVYIVQNDLIVKTKSIMNILAKYDVPADTLESLWSVVEQMYKMAKSQLRKEEGKV